MKKNTSRALRQCWSCIDSIRKHPRRLREPLGTVLFSLPDLPAYIAQNAFHLFHFFPHVPPFYYSYSHHFRRRIFAGHSNTRIAAVFAEKHGAKSIVILIHGIFQSKNFRFIRDMAHILYRQHSVAVVDTRDHLGSHSLSPERMASAGMLEGNDLLAIARQLKGKFPHVRIFLVGFSYGGGIAINALKSDEAKECIAGVIAVSPTMMLEHAVNHIDANPGITSPFYPIYSLFQTCLRLRYGASIRTFREYLQGAAALYDLCAEEMIERSSLPYFIDRIEVPALLLIAKNDPVIPKADVGAVCRLADDNDFIHACVREEGGHIAFPFIDKRWFYSLIDAFTVA